MSKLLKVTTAAFLAMSLAACSSTSTASSAASASASSSASSSEKEEETQTVGLYTVYNATNDQVTELYLYPTDGEKGENLVADHALKTAHAMYLTYDAGDKAADTELTLEFVTKGGYTGSFTTLHIETAPISLIAEDAKTGATAISFAATPATYTIKNVTGEEVKEVYIYPTGSSDKGKNLVGDAAQDGGEQVVTFDGVPENAIVDNEVTAFTIEFTTASGYTGKFETLSYEVAPIYLIAEDAKTGATAISFVDPSAN